MDHSPLFSEPTSPVVLDLGQLSGGARSSYAAAISADGRLVVGSANHGNYGQVAFSWTPATGMVSLDQSFLVRHSAFASAVSDDGAVVVGAWNVMGNGLDRAFRWTKQSGMVSLGILPGSDRSSAEAVSADGRVVVGMSNGAFRWTESTGMVALPGRSMWGATAVTADGRTVYGDEMGADDIHVVRWGEDGTITRYPNPPGVTASFPAAVTPDGSVLVGQQHLRTGDSRSQVEAVVWYSPTKRVLLGFLHGGNYSKATAVSPDGTVIVGMATDGSKNNTRTAFRWTPTTGMQSIAEWVISAGGSAAASIPIEAHGVSGDGSRVVGALSNGDPFVAIVPKQRSHTSQAGNTSAAPTRDPGMPVNWAALPSRRQFARSSPEVTHPTAALPQQDDRADTVALPAALDDVPPIRLGDTVDIVQQTLHTTVQPQTGFGWPPGRQQGNIAQLHLVSKGLWVFFTEGKVYELRFDPPFSGSIDGIRLGDSASRIEGLLGRSASRNNWSNLEGYGYYLDDKTMVRFMIDSGGTVQTIFLVATQRH